MKKERFQGIQTVIERFNVLSKKKLEKMRSLDIIDLFNDISEMMHGKGK